MVFRDLLPARAGRSFGEPYLADSGATIVPVVRQRTGPGGGNALGLFVIHEGEVKWAPVVDNDRIALLGVLTGLVAATLGCLAVLRQPPWPKVTIHR